MALSLFIILLFVISLFFSFLLKAISLDVFVGRRMKLNKKKTNVLSSKENENDDRKKQRRKARNALSVLDYVGHFAITHTPHSLHNGDYS